MDSATTEADSSTSGAAYEVHITKSDGSHAVVIEDSSFTVLATQTGGGCANGGSGAGNGQGGYTDSLGSSTNGQSS